MKMGKTRKNKTVSDTVCEIHKFSGYAVLSNCFVRSTKLGCPAIGLLGRVMDLPPTWNFSKAGLIALCPDGETAVDSALNDLKEWGYLEIEVKMPNENPTSRIQTVYKFYEYSAKDTSIPQYDYELETFTVDNAVKITDRRCAYSILKTEYETSTLFCFLFLLPERGVKLWQANP